MSSFPDIRASKWLRDQGYSCDLLNRLEMWRVMIDGQMIGLYYPLELVEFAKGKGWVE